MKAKDSENWCGMTEEKGIFLYSRQKEVLVPLRKQPAWIKELPTREEWLQRLEQRMIELVQSDSDIPVFRRQT